MTRRTLVIGLSLLFLAAFAAGGLFYKSQQTGMKAGLASEQALSAAQADKSSVETAQLEQSYSPTFGPADAKVTIVEFFDPACEACRAFYPFVKKILAARSDDLRLVLRYATFHQGSYRVVRMLEAARMQGKFQVVLEAVLAVQPQWASHQGPPNMDVVWKAAEAAGLDVDKARKDMLLPGITALLKQEAADVEAFGVSKTPTFFVNGKGLPSFGSQQLVDLVRSELAN